MTVMAMVEACVACGGTGYEPVFESGVRRVRPCTKCDFWARKRGDVFGLPVEERGRKLADYTESGKTRRLTKDNRAALDAAAQFVKGLHPDLYLYGDVGTGKTALASALLAEMFAAGKSAAFFRVPEVLLRLSPDRESDAAAQALMRRLETADIVVMDDVGADQGSDYARRTLQLVYEHRVDRGLRTIWTSNLDPQGLAEFLGDSRLASRIVGRAKVVELAGSDYRAARGRKRHGEA